MEPENEVTVTTPKESGSIKVEPIMGEIKLNPHGETRGKAVYGPDGRLTFVD